MARQSPGMPLQACHSVAWSQLARLEVCLLCASRHHPVYSFERVSSLFYKSWDFLQGLALAGGLPDRASVAEYGMPIVKRQKCCRAWPYPRLGGEELLLLAAILCPGRWGLGRRPISLAPADLSPALQVNPLIDSNHHASGCASCRKWASRGARRTGARRREWRA